MSLLQVRDLSVSFRVPSGSVRAISDCSFDLEQGHVLVVIGESGSGKTVLTHAITRLLPRNVEVDGSIRLAGNEVLALSEPEMRQVRARQIALIPQGASGALNPVRRVGPLMLEIARARGLAPGQAEREITSVLAELGLAFDDVADRYPHQLSGGMQQRVVNAIAMLGSPQLVIADEPTYGLDSHLVDVTAAQLNQIVDKGAALLVITHDLRLADRLGGRVAVIYASYLVELRKSRHFFVQPLHPYSQALLQAMPERGGSPIPGLSPELTALPAGCAFSPRCTQLVDGCAVSVPPPFLTADSSDMTRCFLHDPR
jgi:peptide/nickel transport system ATP-binding protein